MKLRSSVIGILGVIGLIVSTGGLLSPSTVIPDDNLSATALSNLRAYAAASLVWALFALYSLSRKHLQDIALISVMINFGGWSIGQTISYFADGKPDTFTVDRFELVEQERK